MRGSPFDNVAPGYLPGVDRSVVLKIILPTELPMADSALKGHLSRVNTQVLLEISRSAALPTADRTLNWFLSNVNVKQVCFQAKSPSELFVTD